MKQNNKSIWEVVNEVTKKQGKQNIDERIQKAFQIKSATEIANDFNENFYKQVPELKKKFQEENETHRKGSFAKRIKDLKKRKKRGKVSNKTMYIGEVREVEIHNIIRELNNNKSTGYDKIQTEHIKQTNENITKAIIILISAMIEKETWPEMLKKQIIRPIFKKGDSKDLNNYRPIVLLSNIDKVIEKFFANRIKNFLEGNNLLTKNQYGYTKHKSTTDLLIEVNELITTGLNEGKYIGIILVDLQKAFDTFDQKIVLKKCYNMGLRGKIYNIIKDYLRNRQTMVRIEDEFSECKITTNGVPQGSVLGPLLYLIYTNDIDEILEKTYIFMFADDTILISININYEEMMKHLQHDFNILVNYYIENELFISKEKTIQMDITVPKMKKFKEIWIVKHHGDCKNL